MTVCVKLDITGYQHRVPDADDVTSVRFSASYADFTADDPAAVESVISLHRAILEQYDIDIICLAGYLKLYQPPPGLARAVINIHPSLIPSFCGPGFYGSRVHRAVKARGCTVSGCTVHFADGNYDEGPIILQRCVGLDYEDSIDTIAAKVFAAECEAFPAAINLVDAKGVDFFWERVAV